MSFYLFNMKKIITGTSVRVIFSSNKVILQNTLSLSKFFLFIIKLFFQIITLTYSFIQINIQLRRPRALNIIYHVKNGSNCIKKKIILLITIKAEFKS
jgi:hypothetical protein